MADDLDDLETWLKERREARSAQQSQAHTDERFDRLENVVGTLAESVKSLVDKSATPAPPGDGGEGDGASERERTRHPSTKTESENEPPPEYAVERVSRMDVPRIYTGDDEPETVTYIDAETGEEKTRPGRQKGRPTPWHVEIVPDAESGEGENAA